jgi:hypothetical protein
MESAFARVGAFITVHSAIVDVLVVVGRTPVDSIFFLRVEWVVDRGGAQESFELLGIAVLLVDSLLVLTVHFEELITVESLVELHLVKVFGIGHRLVRDVGHQVLLELCVFGVTGLGYLANWLFLPLLFPFLSALGHLGNAYLRENKIHEGSFTRENC